MSVRHLNGGPLNNEEMQVPDPPWPWLRIVVQDAYETPKLGILPVALYRLVRYTDGRLGYEYECMD
jgi:hypothetical protein